MKLLTKEVIRKLEKSPLDSQEYNPAPEVIVKFFASWGNWTWYATEGNKDPENGDWHLYGLVEGHERELGYFNLSELKGIRGPFGLKIERDRYFDGKKINTKTLEVF